MLGGEYAGRRCALEAFLLEHFRDQRVSLAVEAGFADRKPYPTVFVFSDLERFGRVGVHDRMPVILKRQDWADWLDGPPDAAGLLCRPYPELMVVERTSEAWNKIVGLARAGK